MIGRNSKGKSLGWDHSWTRIAVTWRWSPIFTAARKNNVHTSDTTYLNGLLLANKSLWIISNFCGICNDTQDFQLVTILFIAAVFNYCRQRSGNHSTAFVSVAQKKSLSINQIHRRSWGAVSLSLLFRLSRRRCKLARNWGGGKSPLSNYPCNFLPLSASVF